MTHTITWEQITDLEKFDYFACGLQPFDKSTHDPIPCPDYCHKYHLVFKKIAEIEHKKGFSKDCSKQKEEYFALWAKLSDITREDPDAESWKFFQKPEPQSDDMKQLLRLLNRAVFNEVTLNNIKQAFSTESSPRTDAAIKSIDTVNTFIIKVGAQIEKLYRLAVSEIKKGDSGRMAGSLNLRDMTTCHSANKLKFPNITESDITAADGRFGGSQQPRDVKGAILLNMVEDRFSQITHDNTFPNHWQKMWPYYTSLKKESKK